MSLPALASQTNANATGIQFTIPGRVGGKGRARSTLIRPKDKPAFISNYTPAKTRLAEATVKSFGAAAMCGRPPFEGPIWLSIEVQIIPPASWSKRKRAEARYVTGKPDLDNVLKLIGDALNHVCWTDDSQIAAITFARFYAEGPEQVVVRFGLLEQAHPPVPAWASKTLPLFGESNREADGGPRIGGQP